MSYFWLYQTSYDNIFHISKYSPGIGTVMGITGSLFLMASTSMIDTGKHNTSWHVFCAGNFFIWSILSLWYYTAVCVIMYVKVKAGGKISMILKVILSLLILYQVILDSRAN